MAKYEDITIDQGSDVAVQLDLINPDKSIKNLTGYSVAAQIRKTFNTTDSDAISFSALVSDPATSGIVTLSLTNTQTDLIAKGRYFYDVELSHLDSDSNTVVERILEGQLTVTPSVTR